MNKRQALIVACLIATAAAGFGYGRLRHKPASAVYGGFEPFTIKQKVEGVGDDGSVRLVEEIVIYTASDGGLREVHTRYDESGQPSPDMEQIIRPGVGSYFVYHKSKLVSQWLENPPPVQHLTSDLIQAREDYAGTKVIEGLNSGPLTVYVLRDDSSERWLAPEFGMVPLGMRERKGNVSIVRTTLSISPGDEANALRFFNDYEQEKALVKKE